MINTAYKKILKNKTILVTGGTGSFGHEVVTLLLTCYPKQIIIFSRDEKKQFDMRNKFNNRLLKFVIGDVRNKESIKRAIANVDYIFHAAALKQVPTCEFFPMEAIETNVLGTQNVISVAIENKVKKVVVLSTDKAVYPINVIGLTKALMEKLIISEARNIIENKNKDTILCGVRYGNVLYTRGSVVPYLISLIKKKEKLPITNYSMTRFLLPLPEAVDLVLFALASGENGYIYVRKSMATNLETIAQALCQIFAYSPGYFEVGIRAGEKKHETLITEEEIVRAIDVKEYYKIPPESQGLDYNKYFFRKEKLKPMRKDAFTSANTKQLTLKETIALFMRVPELALEKKNYKKAERRAYLK